MLLILLLHRVFFFQNQLYCLRRSSIHHLAIRGLALFHGSVAARLQRASKLAARSFSLMLKSSSRGASGRVDSRTSIDRSELVDDADAVLRALERRLGRGMELKRILMCSSGTFGLQMVCWW